LDARTRVEFRAKKRPTATISVRRQPHGLIWHRCALRGACFVRPTEPISQPSASDLIIARARICGVPRSRNFEKTSCP